MQLYSNFIDTCDLGRQWIFYTASEISMASF